MTPFSSNWYQGDDILRLIEPIGGLVVSAFQLCFIIYRFIFAFYIFRASGIFSTASNRSTHEAAIYVFLLGAAIYSQGAAFHSARFVVQSHEFDSFS